MGIAFAIPVDDVQRIANQLRSTGRVMRGRIGVRIGEVTKDVGLELLLAHVDRSKPLSVLFRRDELAQYAVIRPAAR